MEDIYTSFICDKCKKVIILFTEEVKETKMEGKYLACAHCGSRVLVKEKRTNDLRECMKNNHYKRVKGYLRQVD